MYPRSGASVFVRFSFFLCVFLSFCWSHIAGSIAHSPELAKVSVLIEQLITLVRSGRIGIYTLVNCLTTTMYTGNNTFGLTLPKLVVLKTITETFDHFPQKW